MTDHERSKAEEPTANSMSYAEMLIAAKADLAGSEVKPLSHEGSSALEPPEIAQAELVPSVIPEVQSGKDIERAVDELRIREVFPGEPGYDAALPVYADEPPEVAIETTKRALVAQAWWERAFNNVADYEKNPFTNEPTEEVIFRAYASEIRLLNFSERLSNQQLAEFEEAVAMIYQVVGEKLFELVPWIVMSDTRQPIQSPLTNEKVKPFGVAHTAQRDRFIVLSHNEILSPDHIEHQQRALDRYPRAKLKPLTVSIFQLALIHEIGHMLDPMDGRFDHEIGWTQHGNIRGISEHTGKVCIATESGDVMVALEDVYSSDEIKSSLPATEYGYSSTHEDFAEAFTVLLVAPDSLDPIRRDLVLQALQVNHSNPDQPNQVASPIARPDFDVRTATGEDIVYPQVPIPNQITYRRDARNVIDLL